MEEITISSDLIKLNLDAEDKDQAVTFLSDKLYNQGYVKKEFSQKVLDREREYPTGLPTKIPLAICHTQADYVNKNAVAVAVLKKPIEFQEMGNPGSSVLVEILFVLALGNPKTQVLWLRKFVKIFQNEKALLEIKNCESEKLLEKRLRELLTE